MVILQILIKQMLMETIYFRVFHPLCSAGSRPATPPRRFPGSDGSGGWVGRAQVRRGQAVLGPLGDDFPAKVLDEVTGRLGAGDGNGDVVDAGGFHSF